MKLCEQLLNPLQLHPRFEPQEIPDFKSMKLPRLSLGYRGSLLVNGQHLLSISLKGSDFYVGDLKIPRKTYVNNQSLDFIKKNWPKIAEYIYKQYGPSILNSI